MRSAALMDHGLSRHYLHKEVLAGRLVRVRRGWVAQPHADPQLVTAARHGLMLSCITEAARQGLWVRDTSTPHYAVLRSGAEIRPEGAVLHYHAPLVPCDRYALSDTLENTLVHVARCEPFEDAVATWDSALNKRLVDRSALAQLPLPVRARKVLDATDPFADSGLESYVRLRLRWLGVPIVAQAWLDGHRVDFLLGERLVIQIDGAHHTGAQRTSDITHDAKLALRGYTVIRLAYSQVMDAWPTAQASIMRAVALGLHQRAELV
ncbi:hypothetical protein GCM10020360_06430 [Nonlabens tegetincola]